MVWTATQAASNSRPGRLFQRTSTNPASDPERSLAPSRELPAGYVVGQGDTATEAIADVQSAIRFHIDTFETDAFTEDSPLLHAYMTESELVNAD